MLIRLFSLYRLNKKWIFRAYVLKMENKPENLFKLKQSVWSQDGLGYTTRIWSRSKNFTIMTFNLGTYGVKLLNLAGDVENLNLDQSVFFF